MHSAACCTTEPASVTGAVAPASGMLTISAGTPGHGCGHNLLGSASALAAVAIKEEMKARGLKGTIRYYGTPAEEGGEARRVDWTIVKRMMVDQRSTQTVSTKYVLKRDGTETRPRALFNSVSRPS